jgi:hypothetical protein
MALDKIGAFWIPIPEETVMNLTTQAQIVPVPEIHYIFIKKTSPFMETAPAAYGVVFGMVDDGKIRMRDDYCPENDATDPRVTPEDKNVTEILIPSDPK